MLKQPAARFTVVGLQGYEFVPSDSTEPTPDPDLHGNNEIRYPGDDDVGYHGNDDLFIAESDEEKDEKTGKISEEVESPRLYTLLENNNEKEALIGGQREPEVAQTVSVEARSQTSSGGASPQPVDTVFSVSPIAERGRSFAARQTRRLVSKDGSCSISSGNVTKRKRKYLVDIFTTCVDMKWRYILALFLAAFILSWFFFALVWWLILLRHSDHEHVGDPDWNPCVANVYDFITALLFSIETQHTIGYGFRVMEPTCPDAVILVMVQSCLGVFIQSLMTGLIFAKLSQPKKRAHTILFSRTAVINKRDGVYCLMFRVGDMRRSHFVGTSIRALLVKDRLTKEGECIPLCQFPLTVKTETFTGDDFVFLVWPVVIVHKIDSSSPLWDVSAEQLLQDNFEIIVILEGIVESTGMTTQVRTSYLPSEILWGHCLAPLLTYQKENGQYKIDYAQFHAAVPMASMPECSAKDFASRGFDGNTEIIPSMYYTLSSKNNTLRPSMLRRMRESIRPRKSHRTKSSDSDAGNGAITGSSSPTNDVSGSMLEATKKFPNIQALDKSAPDNS